MAITGKEMLISRWRWPAISIAAVSVAGSLFAASPTDAPGVTFSKDVAPLLQKHCQACHRPGESAPFSLLSYQQARPWAKAMKEAVLLKKMPPWFADPRYGKCSNDRSLSQSDVDTLVAWADGGAGRRCQGSAGDARLFGGVVHPKAGRGVRVSAAVSDSGDGHH